MKTELIELDRLQRLVANSIARSPAGVNLLLIGGFRYRLLDNSQPIDEQIEAATAQQMNAGGGGRTVLDSVLNVLMRVFGR